MVAEDKPFWNKKTLGEMSPKEWESLCDGCGRCCLHKLEDEDSGALYYTNIACHLLDSHTCRCRHYMERQSRVPDCLVITPEQIDKINWLPTSCAYRRLANGQSLEWWHPLVSGNPETVHQARVSVRGRALSEDDTSKEDLEDHIIGWIEY